MKNKDKLIIKICKSVIVVFGVLTVFNVIMLINKKSYALFQKTVETDNIIHIQTASEFPSDNKGTDKIKDTVGEDEGIKGVDPKTGKECANTGECPEYRYVGTNVNNYIYFNCKQGQKQNNENCELWRIVGIFTDEETGEEHLKIVKDNVLKATDFPATYKHDETTYNIKYSGGGDWAYWNYVKGDLTDRNDWATAVLQYWLNGEDGTGYLSKLSTEAKGMIADTKYYLGSVASDSSDSSKKDTVVQAYQHEREVSKCTSGVGPVKNKTSTAVESSAGCRVWAGNAATWTGKVGLLYPSDYGFSADSSNWNSELYNFNSGSNTSWLQSANHSKHEWLLSPSSLISSHTSRWDANGLVSRSFVGGGSGVRPVLNLKSNVEISGGTGEETTPYTLILN